MRRLIGISILPLALALLVGAAGCKRRPQKVEVQATDEEAQDLETMVHVADPRGSLQLVRGFHDVEQSAWRWTMRKFSVTLRPPAGAAQKGATLQLKFAVPDPVIERLKDITLVANVQGVPLESETCRKPGEYTYTRDVPARAFSGDAVTVDFALDKVLPPSASDNRELGVVVSSVGFEAK
jgi:hypothetical protein